MGYGMLVLLWGLVVLALLLSGLFAGFWHFVACGGLLP
jgi:hypothetical protein